MSKSSAFRQTLLEKKFVFTSRPNPVSGDLRISWGIAVLMLAVFYSYGKRANLQKLQFLAHSVRIKEGREEVRGLLSGQYRPSEVSVRVEPSLNRSVNLAHALKLVEIRKGTTVALTDEGKRVASDLDKMETLLEDERRFLREVAPKLTNELMNRVWRMEDLI